MAGTMPERNPSQMAGGAGDRAPAPVNPNDPSNDPSSSTYQFDRIQAALNDTSQGSLADNIKTLQDLSADLAQHPEKYYDSQGNPLPGVTAPNPADLASALRNYKSQQLELIKQAASLAPAMRLEQQAIGKIAKTPEERDAYAAAAKLRDNQADLAALQVQAAQRNLDVDSPEALAIKNSQGITAAELQNEQGHLRNAKDTADAAWTEKQRAAEGPYLPQNARSASDSAAAQATVDQAKANVASAIAQYGKESAQADAAMKTLDAAYHEQALKDTQSGNAADLKVKQAQAQYADDVAKYGAQSAEADASMKAMDAAYHERDLQQRQAQGEKNISATQAGTEAAQFQTQRGRELLPGELRLQSATLADTQAQTAAQQLKTQQDTWGEQVTKLNQIRDAWARGDIKSADQANQMYQDVLSGSTPYQRMQEANTTGNKLLDTLAANHMLVGKGQTTMDPGGAIASSFKRAGLKYSEAPVRAVSPSEFGKGFGLTLGQPAVSGPFSGTPPVAAGAAPVAAPATANGVPYHGDVTGMPADQLHALLGGTPPTAAPQPSVPQSTVVAPAFAAAAAPPASTGGTTIIINHGSGGVPGPTDSQGGAPAYVPPATDMQGVRPVPLGTSGDTVHAARGVRLVVPHAVVPPMWAAMLRARAA